MTIQEQVEKIEELHSKGALYHMALENAQETLRMQIRAYCEEHGIKEVKNDI